MIFSEEERAYLQSFLREGKKATKKYDFSEVGEILHDWFLDRNVRGKDKVLNHSFEFSDEARKKLLDLMARADETRGKKRPPVWVARADAMLFKKMITWLLKRVGKYGGIPSFLARERDYLDEALRSAKFALAHPENVEEQRAYLQSFLREGTEFAALFDSLKAKDRVRITTSFPMSFQSPHPVEYIVARRTRNKFGYTVLHFNNANGSKQRGGSILRLSKSPSGNVHPTEGDLAGTLINLEKL